MTKDTVKCDRCKSDMKFNRMITWSGYPNPAKEYICKCGYKMVWGVDLE